VCIGAEGFSTEEDQELLSRIEKQLKRRFVIGSQVSEHAIVQDFTRQVASLTALLSSSFDFRSDLCVVSKFCSRVLFVVEISRACGVQSVAADDPT